MKLIEKIDPLLSVIVKQIAHAGGRAFLVGGGVRDHFLNIPLHDIDIEVHALALSDLEKILAEHGTVNMVGKSFGVLRLYGLDVDWSLPRTDSAGRKPEIIMNPNMTFEAAARRRDLTMNAMGIDLMTDQLLDPFNGLDAMRNKVLSLVDQSLFTEDPLRFFRVMQFVGRFQMVPDQQLDAVCSTLSLDGLSRERIEEEFRKLLLYARRPSLGIRWLKKVGRLKHIVPELYDTIGVEQNPIWHPEGDVFEHSMQALDAAAAIAQSYGNDESKKLTLLYAALCHDLGKVTKTSLVNGVIKSIGHEVESGRLAVLMMKRITCNADLIKTVSVLALHHMAPGMFIANNAGLPAYKRLAYTVKNCISLSFLADLSLADKRGRNGESLEPLSCEFVQLTEFKARACKAGVWEHYEQPLLKGADLLAFVQPGKDMGRLLEMAYKMQINQSVSDRNILLKKLFDR